MFPPMHDGDGKDRIQWQKIILFHVWPPSCTEHHQFRIVDMTVTILAIAG